MNSTCIFYLMIWSTYPTVLQNKVKLFASRLTKISINVRWRNAYQHEEKLRVHHPILESKAQHSCKKQVLAIWQAPQQLSYQRSSNSSNWTFSHIFFFLNIFCITWKSSQLPESQETNEVRLPVKFSVFQFVTSSLERCKKSQLAAMLCNRV